MLLIKRVVPRRMKKIRSSSRRLPPKKAKGILNKTKGPIFLQGNSLWDEKINTDVKTTVMLQRSAVGFRIADSQLSSAIMAR